MSRALQLTGADLIRAIGNAAALPGIDAAIEQRAEAVADELAQTGATTTVLKRGPGDYLVRVRGEDVFAREFGAVDKPATPFIAGAIARAQKP